MKRTDALYQSFVEILREELVPAMGCTEPIAIAYAAAQARAVLGKRPERVRIEVSGNIIKNVKSVVVPHTGSMHGIAAAAAAGIIAGREEKELEVLSEVTDEQIADTVSYTHLFYRWRSNNSHSPECVLCIPPMFCIDTLPCSILQI